MSQLSEAQNAALANPGRVLVIRAGPGTGKTRVFVAEFRRRLEAWSNRRAGIAALSFTNVARDEIEDRLGGPPPAPHFVGTLDAFIWRFVVRPFAGTIEVAERGARLVPSPLAEEVRRPTIKVGPNVKDQESLFRLSLQWTGSERRVIRNRRLGRPEKVANQYVDAVRAAKFEEWKRSGRVTHSDCHFLAAKILAGERGSSIAQLIIRRFPVLLIDEFQDTNGLLGRAIVALLECADCTALVVGDPDQAIFQFGGADRDLFSTVERLPGAKCRELTATHRFGEQVAKVASSLSRSKVGLESHSDDPGRALLVRHSCAKVELDDKTRTLLNSLIKDAGGSSAAFVARKNAWVRDAGGSGTKTIRRFKSRGPRMLHQASLLLRRGSSSRATSLIDHLLSELVLGEPHSSPELLQEHGLEMLRWRQAVHRILFTAAEQPAGEKWDAWRLRMKELVGSEARVLRESVDSAVLGQMFKKGFASGTDGERHFGDPAPPDSPWEPLTVHAAKGREFDSVVVYCPKPGGTHKAECPSQSWWSKAEESEEREIAYVAVSRTKSLLVLCVHDETLAALRESQPEFVDLFEQVS